MLFDTVKLLKKQMVRRVALIISQVILVAAVILEVVLNKTSPMGIDTALITLLVGLLLLRYAWKVRHVKNSEHEAGFDGMVVFTHAMIAIGIIFLAPAGSGFAYLWFIPLFDTIYRYRSQGVGASLIALFVSLEMQLLRSIFVQNLKITKEEGVAVLVQFAVMSAIAAIAYDTREFARKSQAARQEQASVAQFDRQRLVALINNMTDAVITTDEKGEIKLYNAAALSVLDTNSDLNGRKINEVMHLIDKESKHIRLMEMLHATKINTTNRDLRLVYSATDNINIHLNISPIRLGFKRQGEGGYILTFRDITREKSLEEERDEFISVVSHELRTPIAITEANISNAKFIADRKPDPAAISKALEAAHQQTLYLANMINDLSTLSRAERGVLQMAPEEVNPAALLDELWSDYHADAEKKNLKLIKQVGEPAPQNLFSSKLYVREILQNFITNAIKYTREGSVTISVSQAKKDHVTFVIKDTGIGISKGDQTKIFEKFFRSEDFRTRENNGTGLGLYITRKLAKLLDADIQFDSVLNEGSEFRVTFHSMTSPPQADEVAVKHK